MRDHAADMEKLHERHKAGNKRAVLDALFVCLCSYPAKEVPGWARDAFRHAYGEVYAARARHWDDVFGDPWPKGHLKDKRLRIEYRYQVWRHCRQLHAEGMPIGEPLFKKVGKKVGIGTRQTREMFYEQERAGGRHSNLWSMTPPELVPPGVKVSGPENRKK